MKSLPSLTKEARQILQAAYPKALEVMKQYYSDGFQREMKKVKGQNSRARKLGVYGVLSTYDWIDLLKEKDYTCLKCGIRLVPLTIDHVIPISKGGMNVIENVQPLCRSCNSIKATKETDYR